MTGRGTRPSGQTWRTFALLLVGGLLVQTAWLLVVGPFRAIDEFDHAQRADAVASGQLRPLDGGLVSVDRQFADAVRPVCLSRSPRPGGCQPEGDLPDDRVAVYDTAATYDPLYYAVVGEVSRVAEGTARLYAMRATSTALTATVTALGLTIILRGFRSRWPGRAALVTLTPMATYAAMVVAPNGLETSCALVVWASLLVARHGRPEVRASGLLVWSATVSGVGLALLRSLGPFWLVAIVAAVLVTGRRGVGGQSLLHARSWRSCAAAWCLASLAGVAWSGLMHTNWPSGSAGSVAGDGLATSSTPPIHLFPELLAWPFLWVLQCVGVIPYRDQALPMSVYVLVLLVWLVLVAVAWRVGTRSTRVALGLVAAVSLAVPVAATVLTYRLGWPWQGRYGWPLSLGSFLLSGAALARAQVTTPPWARRLVTPALGAVMALAGVISQAHVLHGELSTSPLAHSDAWFRLPMPVVGLMTVVGFGLMVLAIERGPAAPAVRRPGAGDHPQVRSDPAEAATH